MNNENQIVYEQSPWELEYIESLLPNLKGIIQIDGEWHDVPALANGLGKYRVFQQRYFQAAYAQNHNSVFNSILMMSPVASDDDAEWTIWKNEDGYGITSVFTLTPGPFDNTAEVASWLDRHGLGFEADKGGLKGVAYFADLEQGCLLDAMERLAWLENVILSLNRRMNLLSETFWSEIRQGSDTVIKNLDQSLDWATEIIPVPETHKPKGPKHRKLLHPMSNQ